MLLTTAERRTALQTMKSRPSPGADPGPGEAFAAAWGEYVQFHNTTAEYQNRLAVINDHLARYEEKTGERLLNPEIGGFAFERAAKYAAIREKFDGAGLSFPDDEALQTEAIGRASQSRQTAANVRERSTSWGSFWGDLAGSMAGAMTDPINAGSVAFGAGWSRGILQTALIESGVVGTSQAVIEAGTYGYKRQVDPDWGALDAISNIVASGAVGTIFTLPLGTKP